MYYPTLKEARTLAASGPYREIPVARELLSDFLTPIQALRILRARDNHCFLLESAADQEGWGRWTFLGFEPELEITAKDGVVQLRDGERTSSRIQRPGEALRQILSEHKSPKIPGQPPFTGGLVGYFSYDYMKYAEPTLRLTGEDQERFKDMDLMLFRSVIAFDNFRQKLILITNADASDLDETYPAACAQLDRMAELLRHGAPPPSGRPGSPRRWRPCSAGSSSAPWWSRPSAISGRETSSRWCCPTGWRPGLRGHCWTCTASCAPSIPPPTCSTSPATTWSWPGRPLRHW